MTTNDLKAKELDSSLKKQEGLKNVSTKRKFEISEELASNIVKHAKCNNTRNQRPDTEHEEVEYYFENGLRKVYPYYYTYSTFCKGRWVGKKLLEVFATEFRAFTEEQYQQSILSGSLMVNKRKVDPGYILRDNDCITNRVHRHEVGVIAAPIKIIHLSDDLVVINKPPSIPVHPCGRYRHNSLLFILRKEHDLKDLHTIHRLDRLTSGVMLLTRTLKKSQELDEQVRSHKLTKEYLCRVDGLFPDGVVTCNEPVEVLSPKIGVCIVSPTGKESTTAFEKMSYNGKSSVVKCMPKTGRMHQIRVHLQYLGYPIVNDPIYNNEAFGPLKGKGGDTGKSRDKLISDLMETHNLEKWLLVDDENEDKDSDLKNSYENDTLIKILNHNLCMTEYSKLENEYKKDQSKTVVDPNCDMCHKHYKDPEPKDLMLFLHAHRYKGDTWEFETEMPIWATENWSEM